MIVGTVLTGLLLSILLYVGRAKKLEVEIAAQEKCTDNYRGKFRLLVKNTGRIPIFCRIRVTLRITNLFNGENIEISKRLLYGGRGTSEYPFLVESEWSGKLEVQVLQVIVGDLVGICRKRKMIFEDAFLGKDAARKSQSKICKQHSNNRWIAKVCYLPRIEKLCGEPVGEGIQKGDIQSNRPVKGMDVNGIADIRQYVPGEPLRHIHWRASQKWNELYVKEYEQEEMAFPRLYLEDVHEHMDWSYEKLEQEFVRVHSIAVKYLQEGQAFFAKKKGHPEQLIQTMRQWQDFI